MLKSKRSNSAPSQQEQLSLNAIKTKSAAGYRGRFAPSPTGPLHFGSLVAALGSYLQAKHQGGCWIIRIEDLDPPREQAGATEAILHTLEVHGMHSDEPIVFQSQRHQLYQQVVDDLIERQLLYPCVCTRQIIKQMPQGYDGRCAHAPADTGQPHAWRLRNSNQQVSFADVLHGEIVLEPHLASEDYIVKRKDGLFAYQLAVVVDDIAQGITEVVRGYDIHDSSIKQAYLFELLGGRCPHFLHLPLAMRDAEQKLSKQNQAPAIDDAKPVQNLYNALSFLGQQPPKSLLEQNVNQVLEWGVQNWQLAQIPKQSRIVNLEQ